MRNFLRALRLALQFKLTLVGVITCSIVVALFWGANVGVMYPLVEVVFQGKAAPQWIQQELDDSAEKIDVLERQIASTVGRLKTTDATERRSLQQQLGYERSQLQSEQLVHGRLESLQPWVDRYMPSEPFPTLVAIIGFLLLGTLIKVVFLVGNIILAERLSQLVAFQLRKQFFRRTLRMDLASFGDDRTATLIARFTNDMDAVTGGVQVVIGKLLREPLKLAVFFGCAGWICWRLLLLSLIVTPPIMYLVSRLASSIKRANRKAMEEMATMYGHLSESFHSIQVVQAYTMEAGERNRFHQTAKKLYAKSMKIVTYAALTKPATELMGLTVISMAILAGGYLVLNQETHLLGIRMSDRPLDFGSIMAFFGFLIAMTDPARRMTDVMGMLQRATAAADRVFETMDREPTIDDPAEPRTLTTPQFDIVLDRVSFGYHQDRPILNDLSLTIPFGQAVAIVGPNGCGKSTLLKLLPRFYDPSAGEVRFGETPLPKMRVRDVRGQIGLVTQQTVLFDDTIMNNIRYGSPGATDEEVIMAAKQAHAHEFIVSKLSDGYETFVGEGGNKLSGGQRQRIALARAMLRDPRVLILDEATSQIDPKSEQLIHSALEQFKRGRTTIMVTHRLSTLSLADKILVMDGGRVVDFGSHAELLARCAKYQRLYQTELRESA